MKWMGIEITENRWLRAMDVGVVDGAIFHGPGLAWVNTSPPCFLDKADERLVDLSPSLLDSIIELLETPRAAVCSGPFLATMVPPAPKDDDLIFNSWKAAP